MANSVIGIEKYVTRALDTVLATESKSALLENGSKFIDFSFEQAGYVKIADILMDGLSDYYRANSKTNGTNRTNYNASGVHGDGYVVGNVDFKWRIYELTQDRGKQFQVDNMDNEEDAGQIMANLLAEFLRTKVVPEIDAYRFAKIAGATYATLGNRVTETPVVTKGNANEILHLWNKAFEWLTEHEVPEEDQLIFISPAINTLLSNTEELYKKLTQEEYRSERGVTFKLKAYEGRPIVVVPSDRFYDKITMSQNGYYPSEGAKVLNYIVCSKKAIVPIVKLQKSKVYGPDVVQDFDGYKMNFRLYHDVIIPKNKVIASYVSVSATDAKTKTAKVDVALTETSTKGVYRVDGVYTLPAGLRGTLIYKAGATAFNLGDVDNTATEVAEGDTFDSTNATAQFAVKDSTNAIIAVGTVTGLNTK